MVHTPINGLSTHLVANLSWIKSLSVGYSIVIVNGV